MVHPPWTTTFWAERMGRKCYELWHMRVDDEDRDFDKLLGVYSTREKAEEALELLRHKPGFRDHPDGFEVLDGAMDRTGMTEGFITVWGDEECGGEEEVPPQTVWSITRRGPKDVPIWALGQEPRAEENGGDFARRLMDEHHGPGNWTRDNDEFDQLRKLGNGGNLHPRSNLPSHGSLSSRSHGAQQLYYSLWHRRTDEEDRVTTCCSASIRRENGPNKVSCSCVISRDFATTPMHLRSTRAESTKPTRSKVS